MEALVWLGDDRLAIDELPDVPAGDGEVVFEVVLAGICGSDMHAYRGAAGKRVPPLVLGHEAVGRIAGETGLFVAFPLLGCQACAICAEGHENLCPQRRLLGLDRPGTFASTVVVPRSALVAVPAGMSADVAALTEPLATVIGVFEGVELRAGHTVQVIGCGSIGLLAVYFCVQAGCSVVATDPLAARRRIALDMGATVVDSADDFAARSAHYVIDAVGIEATWSAALRSVRPGGVVVVVGLGQMNGTVAIGDMIRSGITLKGSYAYTREDFAEALALLARVPINTTWLLRMALRDGQAAFDALAHETTPAIKILLQPDGVTD
jgi:threonine dehydrogenase-like Zn-dependent dehydrogenase